MREDPGLADVRCREHWQTPCPATCTMSRVPEGRRAAEEAAPAPGAALWKTPSGSSGAPVPWGAGSRFRGARGRGSVGRGGSSAAG